MNAPETVRRPVTAVAAVVAAELEMELKRSLEQDHHERVHERPLPVRVEKRQDATAKTKKPPRVVAAAAAEDRSIRAMISGWS